MAYFVVCHTAFSVYTCGSKTSWQSDRQMHCKLFLHMVDLVTCLACLWVHLKMAAWSSLPPISSCISCFFLTSLYSQWEGEDIQNNIFLYLWNEQLSCHLQHVGACTHMHATSTWCHAKEKLWLDRRKSVPCGISQKLVRFLFWMACCHTVTVEQFTAVPSHPKCNWW